MTPAASSFPSVDYGVVSPTAPAAHTAPVVDAPVVDAPVVDASVLDAPIVHSPVVDTSVVTIPVVAIPVTVRSPGHPSPSATFLSGDMADGGHSRFRLLRPKSEMAWGLDAPAAPPV